MRVAILLAIIGLALGDFTPGLTVRWSQGLGAGVTYFFKIPTNLTDALSENWSKADRSDGAPLSSLDLYCPEDDYVFCTLYDDNGYVAGLQIALSQTNFTDYIDNMNYLGYYNWTAPDNNEFWTTHQYFVSEEYLATDAETRKENYDSSKLLQDGGIWVDGRDGELIEVDGTTGTDADGIYTPQACIDTMGQHYFYNVSRTGDCERLLPWFTLTTDSQLVGSGIVAPGKMVFDTTKRHWYEDFTLLGVLSVLPYAPLCVYELPLSPGLIGLHIFYTDAPQDTVC